MGQKVHPKGFRLKVVEDWDSTWFSDREYKKYLLSDFNIKKFVKDELSKAGVSSIKLKRKRGLLDIHVKVARPGVVFGKSSINIELIKEGVQKLTDDTVSLHVVEESNPDASAELLGQWVASGLERRVPFRRVIKMAIQKALKAGVEGAKVSCAGRLGGVEIARTEWFREGRVPLHTLRSKIDYCYTRAHTTYGIIGIKVWLNHGEK